MTVFGVSLYISGGRPSDYSFGCGWSFGKGKKVIRRVAKITGEIKSLACPTNARTWVGGMVTKIELPRIAVEAGFLCIANGPPG